MLQYNTVCYLNHSVLCSFGGGLNNPPGHFCFFHDLKTGQLFCLFVCFLYSRCVWLLCHCVGYCVIINNWFLPITKIATSPSYQKRVCACFFHCRRANLKRKETQTMFRKVHTQSLCQNHTVKLILPNLQPCT